VLYPKKLMVSISFGFSFMTISVNFHFLLIPFNLSIYFLIDDLVLSPQCTCLCEFMSISLYLANVLHNCKKLPLNINLDAPSQVMFVNYYSCDPKNLSPLKCMRWSGISESQTSVSQAILLRCLLNSRKSGKALI